MPFGGRTARRRPRPERFARLLPVAVALMLAATGCREPVVDGDDYRSSPVTADSGADTQARPRAPQGGRSGDHWHAAIGFYLCGDWLPPLQSSADPVGIHTHGDGVVHIHPFVPSAAGANAKLGLYFDTVGVTVTSELIRIDGVGLIGAGTRCDAGPGRVQVKLWPSRDPSEAGAMVIGDPAQIRLADNQLITIAFVPEGTDIPRPPSEAQLDQLTDVAS